MEIVNGMLSRVQLRYRMDAHTHTHMPRNWWQLCSVVWSPVKAINFSRTTLVGGRAVVLGADRVLCSESKERSAGEGAH